MFMIVELILKGLINYKSRSSCLASADELHYWITRQLAEYERGLESIFTLRREREF